jgi:hypothetical protein
LVAFGACSDIDDVKDDLRGAVCASGSQRACYDGAAGSEGVGVCHAGRQTCVDGQWSACTGQRQPQAEDCATPEDDDCDGETLDLEDGCVCTPGETGACYTGPLGTVGFGICQSGTGTCAANGKGFANCDGQVLPSIELCDTTNVDENCDGVDDCSGAPVWSSRFGGQGAQLAAGLTADASGFVTVIGTFENTVSFGPRERQSKGAEDVFLVKIDPDGEYYWSRAYGDTGVDRGLAITADPAQNLFLTGSCSGAADLGSGPPAKPTADDAFVVKLGFYGEYVWNRRAGDSGVQVGTALSFTSAPGKLDPADPEGYVIVAGYFDGELDFGCGAMKADGVDVFVSKLGAKAGDCGWSKAFGGPGDQKAAGVAADASGNVVVVGSFDKAAQVDAAALAGDGAGDLFVAKLDVDGTVQWAKGFGDVAGGMTPQVAKSVAMDSQGNVLLAGEIAGTVDWGNGPVAGSGDVDAFVLKLAPTGEHVWSARFGEAGSEGAESVSVDAADNVLVTGYFQGTVDFGKGPLTATAGGAHDVFALKRSAAGQPLWSRRYGDEAEQSGQGIAAGPTGSVFLTGVTAGKIDLGGGPLTTVDGKDAFLSKMLP